MEKMKKLNMGIFSEELSSSLVSFPYNCYFSLKQQDELVSLAKISPSPFQEEGRGEGESDGKQLGVVVGSLKDMNTLGQPLVDFPGNLCLKPVPARSTIHVKKTHLGQDVVLMFDQGDIGKPIVMGILYSSSNESLASGKDDELRKKQLPNVEVDGEQLTFTAKNEIVLKCGKASITLTKAGKIIIKGAYVSSRSSGPNLIKGGSVQLN